MSVFPVFRRLRQEDYNLFEANLDCVVRLSPKQTMMMMMTTMTMMILKFTFPFSKATVCDLSGSTTQRFEGHTSIAWGILSCRTPVYLLTKWPYSLCI